MSNLTIGVNFNYFNNNDNNSSIFHSPNVDNQLKTFETIDIAFRCFALFTHALYFSLVLAIKELKSRSLIYIHQVNFYGRRDNR